MSCWLSIANLRRMATAILLLAPLSGCGEGYVLVPARLNIVDVSKESFPAVAATVHDILVREGFEDLGKYQAMIELIQRSDVMPGTVKGRQLERLEREQTYLARNRHLRVVLTNYGDGVPKDISLGYTQLSDQFVQLDVFDERPGGFGSYGLAFYDRLLSALQQTYRTSVRVVASPPPTNEAEYRRITIKNTIGAIFAWSLAFVLPFLTTGLLSFHLLRRLRIPTHLRRLTFAVTNAWLAAPLPFPVAFILVMPLPNLFAFPWTSIDYYSRVASYAAVSFPLALVLCAAMSIFLFKGEAKEPSAPVHSA